MRGILAGAFLLAGVVMAGLMLVGLVMMFASPFEGLLQAEIDPHQGYRFALLGFLGAYAFTVLFLVTRTWGDRGSLKPESRPAE